MLLAEIRFQTTDNFLLFFLERFLTTLKSKININRHVHPQIFPHVIIGELARTGKFTMLIKILTSQQHQKFDQPIKINNEYIIFLTKIEKLLHLKKLNILLNKRKREKLGDFFKVLKEYRKHYMVNNDISNNHQIVAIHQIVDGLRRNNNKLIENLQNLIFQFTAIVHYDSQEAQGKSSYSQTLAFKSSFDPTSFRIT